MTGVPVCCVGSSPLARGTRGNLMEVRVVLRLIPARAGNTVTMCAPAVLPPAHPRSRGEHRGSICALWITLGSSPLARGTPAAFISVGIFLRLIPARAGNTVDANSYYAQWTAHPRSRGEHRTAYDGFTPYVGSSPLARGTLRRIIACLFRVRLIPARAGNT